MLKFSINDSQIFPIERFDVQTTSLGRFGIMTFEEKNYLEIQKNLQDYLVKNDSPKTYNLKLYNGEELIDSILINGFSNLSARYYNGIDSKTGEEKALISAVGNLEIIDQVNEKEEG